MLTTERKAHILKLLKTEGRVVAKTLSADLEISEDTIRRDLRELAAEGLLQRVHGGALPASRAVADLKARKTISPGDKLAIAHAATGMIRRGQTVFLDGGTTTLAVARAFPQDIRATVVTHSPDIANALVDHPWIEIELVGGRIFKHSNVAVGAVALESINKLRCDIYFMGATGIHSEHGVTTGDREEAAIKRSISLRSAETIVLASREKIGAVSAYAIADLAEIDGIIVEGGCPESEIEPFTARGVNVIRA